LAKWPATAAAIKFKPTRLERRLLGARRAGPKEGRMLQSSENQYNSPKSNSPASNPNAYNPVKTVTAPVDQATIGRTLVIKGEISGSESLYIDGRIEGKITMPESRVTIGRNGKVDASIQAREVVIMGKVTGNIAWISAAKARSTETSQPPASAWKTAPPSKVEFRSAAPRSRRTRRSIRLSLSRNRSRRRSRWSPRPTRRPLVIRSKEEGARSRVPLGFCVAQRFGTAIH
jgi:hypothetical protein